jgi:hypothetical protein
MQEITNGFTAHHEEGGAPRPLPAATGDAPRHLIPLPGGEWSLWRWLCLRGAGFPASGVLVLAAPESAAAADRLLDAEEAVESARATALTAVNAALDELRGREHWDDPAQRDPLLKALRALKSDKQPRPLAEGSRAATEVETLRAAIAAREEARLAVQAALTSGVAEATRALRRVASNDRFREAVIWQNRRAYHTGLRQLLRKDAEAAGRGSKQRQYESLVASYLQRYSVKNDTIGFFGPVGWGRFVDEGAAITAEPGAGGGIVESRQVYFEGWGIDVLAEQLSAHKVFAPWFCPRVLPFVRIDGNVLHLSIGQQVELSAGQVAVIARCDGERTAKEIAAGLMAADAPLYGREEQVFQALEQLNNWGLITWTAEIPVCQYPEKALRRIIERVDDENLRAPALKALDEVEAGRAAVAAAAGDPDRLDAALDEAETAFTRLTGASVTKAEGQMYAARTLVYEDCRRDVELRVGPEVLAELGPALSLLLTSARWYTYEVAKLYRRAFRRIYTELAQKANSKRVSAVDFWIVAHPLVNNQDARLAATLIPQMQRQWTEVLGLQPGQRRVALRSEDVRAKVESVFAAPRAGWSAARYHSPDVMIAAGSTEAVRRGDYQLVLGEFHLGINTLRGLCFMSQHPAPAEIYECLEADFPRPRIVPMTPKSWPQLTARTLPVFVTPKDYRLQVTSDSFSDLPAQSLPISSLYLEETAEGLMMRSHDGRINAEAVESFGEILSAQVVGGMKVTPSGKRTPRVTIDRLVLSRETWRFTPDEIDFAATRDEAERFVVARRWARRHELPRFVFVSAPVEVKPFYVDFDSPAFIDILAKVVRRTIESGDPNAVITVSEMLPNPQQLWLPDAAGQLYTSELRIVAVDPQA